jgi:Uma2 family endonuclease
MIEVNGLNDRSATMARSAPTFKFTYEDYRNTPDDTRLELLDGDLVVIPAPREIHQRVLMRLAIQLYQAVNDASLGHVYIAPFDVVLSDTNVVQPDLLFVSNERAHIITDENIQGAPDLVIEILSPTSAGRDQTFKRSLYAKYGVKEYWLVDTDASTVTVLQLREQRFEQLGICGAGQSLASPTLGGFTINSDEIFAKGSN